MADKKPINYPLGKNQRDVLWSLIDHGSWKRDGGWLWDTHSNTQRLMDNLVRRELATKNEETGVYTPTEKGRDEIGR